MAFPADIPHCRDRLAQMASDVAGMTGRVRQLARYDTLRVRQWQYRLVERIRCCSCRLVSAVVGSLEGDLVRGSLDRTSNCIDSVAKKM